MMVVNLRFHSAPTIPQRKACSCCDFYTAATPHMAWDTPSHAPTTLSPTFGAAAQAPCWSRARDWMRRHL